MNTVHNHLSRLNVMNNLDNYKVNDETMTKALALDALQKNISNMKDDNKEQLALLTKILCISSREEFNKEGSFFAKNTSPKFSVESISNKLASLGIAKPEESAKSLIYLCTHKNAIGAGIKEFFLGHHSLTDGAKNFIVNDLGIALAKMPIKSKDIDVYLRNPDKNNLDGDKYDSIKKMILSIDLRLHKISSEQQKIFYVATKKDMQCMKNTDEQMLLQFERTAGIRDITSPPDNDRFNCYMEGKIRSGWNTYQHSIDKIVVMQDALFTELFEIALIKACNNGKQFYVMVDGKTPEGRAILNSTLNEYFPVVDMTDNEKDNLKVKIHENRFNANYALSNSQNIKNIINTCRKTYEIDGIVVENLDYDDVGSYNSYKSTGENSNFFDD